MVGQGGMARKTPFPGRLSVGVHWSETGGWSGCPDSNRGPLAPKASALTRLSYTPQVSSVPARGPTGDLRQSPAKAGHSQ